MISLLLQFGCISISAVNHDISSHFLQHQIKNKSLLGKMYLATQPLSRLLTLYFLSEHSLVIHHGLNYYRAIFDKVILPVSLRAVQQEMNPFSLFILLAVQTVGISLAMRFMMSFFNLCPPPPPPHLDSDVDSKTKSSAKSSNVI